MHSRQKELYEQMLEILQVHGMSGEGVVLHGWALGDIAFLNVLYEARLFSFLIKGLVVYSVL